MIKNNNIPNLFIIGAPKSGTTALASNISQHHEIYLGRQKEPRFFDALTFFDFPEDYPIKTTKQYLDLYKCVKAAKATYRIDASVFNMYSATSIKNILKLSPNAKFMIVLRDPVTASIGMHTQRLKYHDSTMRELSEDFMQCWNMLEERSKGNAYPKKCRNKFLFRYDLLFSYEKYIPKIIELVKPENLLISFYEDFRENPDVFYSDIFKFLEVSNIKIKNNKINPSHAVRKSRLLAFIELAINKTKHFRKKIGMSGGIFSLVNKSLYNRRIIKNHQKAFADKKVYDRFSTTYKFLEHLKR